MSAETFQYVLWYKGLFEKLSSISNGGQNYLKNIHQLTQENIILDFGCGLGECVHKFRDDGYNAFGCDIEFPVAPEDPLKSYLECGIIRKIDFVQDPQDQVELFLEHGILVKTDEASYHLPFENNTFDIIISSQVFEHVMDYPAVLAELSRISKPTGINVHIFPGKWMVKESHTYIPFSSVMRTFWWVYLWTFLGIRNQFQQQMSAIETAKRDYWYLHRRTKYLYRWQIQRYVAQYFDECRFTEESYFYVSPRAWECFKRYPFLLKIYRAWYSDTQMRVLVLGKKKILS